MRTAARGIPLDPLIVEARGREQGRDGFMRRRELGSGAFLTPDSIELRHPRQVADAFRAADGIILYERPGASARIGSMRGHRGIDDFAPRILPAVPDALCASALPRESVTLARTLARPHFASRTLPTEPVQLEIPCASSLW